MNTISPASITAAPMSTSSPAMTPTVPTASQTPLVRTDCPPHEIGESLA